MAAALNSQSKAARVMSVNTIATSPPGGLIPPAAPASKAPCDADEVDDDDDELVELVDDGRVLEPYMLDRL